MPRNSKTFVYFKRSLIYSLGDYLEPTLLAIYENALNTDTEFKRLLVEEGVLEATQQALQYAKDHSAQPYCERKLADALAALDRQASMYTPLSARLNAGYYVLINPLQTQQQQKIHTKSTFVYEANFGKLKKTIKAAKSMTFDSCSALECYLIKHMPAELRNENQVMVAVELCQVRAESRSSLVNSLSRLFSRRQLRTDMPAQVATNYTAIENVETIDNYFHIN